MNGVTKVEALQVEAFRAADGKIFLSLDKALEHAGAHLSVELDVNWIDTTAISSDDVADQLAAGAPLAQSMIKRGLDRSSTFTFEQALSFEEQAQAVLLASEDLVEGAGAFVEKRPPEFKGR